MASTQGQFASQLANFWKDDFAPLEAAGQAVLNCLREEEAAPDADLYRRIATSSPGSHSYFSDDSKVSLQWKHIHSDPLPALLSQQLSSVQSHSLMGLLAPASLAWMSVDHKLYLWPFQRSSQDETLICFEIPSQQCVVSVGLVKPKKGEWEVLFGLKSCHFSRHCAYTSSPHFVVEGVFKDDVKWGLVVTTPVEIFFCALVECNASNPDARNVAWRLVPTSFTLPTDGVRILSIAGTESGRIFLGGDDGCVYEMSYEGRIPDQKQTDVHGVDLEIYLDQFYDKGKTVTGVIITDAEDRVKEVDVKPLALGKRAWSAIAGEDEAYAAQPRKCRKLNRTSASFLRSLLPDFITNQAASLFGGKNATGGGGIVQIVVDEERQTLYTLGVKGWICTFDLQSQSSGDDIRLTSVMDTVKTSRLYLEAVSRGQVVPPNTFHSSVLGTLVFPGGSQAAQGGVGGMDGARNILKIANASAERSNGSTLVGGNVLKPVSIQVVAPSESSRVTLVAITQGGLRLYISSLAPGVFNHGTASALQSNGRTRTISTLLAPHTRLTLCHMRAPPMNNSDKKALDSSNPAEGAFLPRYSSPLKVNAAWYCRGNFIAAVEGDPVASNGHDDQTRLKQDMRGDTLIATCPDAAAHLATSSQLSTYNGTKGNSDDKERFLVVGGISETVSFPMSTAFGIQDKTAVIPGGVIWEIASLYERPSAVLKLLNHSMTPSESELGIGLPPAFYPSLKAQKTEGNKPSQDLSAISSTELIDSKLSSTAISVVGSVVAKLLLARPIPTDSLAPLFSPSAGGSSFSSEKQRCYRLSSQDGSNGFSSSAEERTGAVSSSGKRLISESSSKSARLRQWLLKPPVVSLNCFSMQHLDNRPKEIIAVNAGGLHYFRLEGHLLQLANAITSAGERVRDDATVTKFFASFGYKEGCTMCITLAIGCVQAGGSDLRRLAMDAAFARGLVPRLVPAEDVGSSNGSSRSVVSTATSDPMVPKGFEFKPSALCESLYSIFSRLVRPIWNKPAVVVTEGPMIKRQLSNRSSQAPAKVEILLNEASLEEISRPLRNLQSEIRTRLSRAISTVPGIAQPNPNMMEIDAVDGWLDDSQYLTRALQYHNQSRTIQNGMVTHLSAEEAENISRLIEEKNIHSLYRLLSRVVQLLNLVTLLRRAQVSTELREVDWGMLHGLTFRQLAGTSDGQDRLETLLNALVTNSASDKSGSTDLTAQADDLVDKLGEQCYLFFSPGSRYAYNGLRKAAQALDCHPSSALRHELMQAARHSFKQAAQHWRSAALVTGNLLHKKEKESYKEIAQRAIQYGSPLAMAVTKLIQLEDVETAVDVCLSVASNFRRLGEGKEAVGLDIQLFPGQANNKLGWEHNLYHKRRDPVDVDASTSKSTHQISAYGTDVSFQDAVETCYSLIFYHLSFLLKSPNPRLAWSMLEVCSSSTDRNFTSAFYLHLLESGNEDTLLRITSPELEEWLGKREDQDLLWRYYSIQGRHMEAGQELFKRGSDKDLKIPLNTRIEYLSKALSSLQIAMKDAQADLHSNIGEISHKVDEVDESLQVARIQSHILQTIESSTSDWQSEISDEKIEALKTSLVNVSDLYNNYAVVLELYEFCLQIRHVCRHDDREATRFLWKHIISKEILPCATRSDENCQFLKSWVAEIGRDAEVVPFSSVMGGAETALRVFENGDWIKQVEDTVVGLGQKLFGKGRDYVAPPKLLMSYLDGMYNRLVCRSQLLCTKFVLFSFFKQSSAVQCPTFFHRSGRWSFLPESGLII